MSGISISVAMMAHPKRTELVEEIRAQLDRDVPVVWDERESRWDTGKRAMLAYDPACTHHAVIQDDVIPCRDLFAGLALALRHVPAGVPVCGYVGRVRPYAQLVTCAAAEARARGASWLTMHTLNWGPLIVVPTDAIPEMVAYSDRLRDIPNYDRRLSRFWELQRQVPTWYTWPSLVDHADGPSLVPGRIGTDRSKAAHTRVAHTFLGADQSALDVDWSRTAIDTGRISDGKVLFRNKVTGRVLELRPGSARARRMAGLPSWELAGGMTG